MLKIRRPLGRLIFNMGIAIPGKTVFLIETAPWPLGRCGNFILKVLFPNPFPELISWTNSVKLLSSEFQKASLMISKHRFRWWLDAVRHQAVTWTSVDYDQQHHVVSLGHNELTHKGLNEMADGYFADNIFKCNFLPENDCILIQISLFCIRV